MLNEIRTSCYDQEYVFTEAEKVIDLQRSKAAKEKARRRTYFIKQKVCGAILIIIGCLIPMIDPIAGMEALVCLLMGLGLIFTRHYVMTFRR